MIKVKIGHASNNQVNFLEVKGHANSAPYGEDIVCASLSSVVQTAVLGLLMVAGIELEMKRDDNAGYLRFTLPNKLSEDQSVKACAILDTMLCGISDLNEGFSDYVELEVENL